MQEIVIKEVNTGSDEYQKLLHFRNKMLREPLGLNLFEEDLSKDAKDIILLVMEEQEIVGCLMLHPIDKDVLQLRQMAIALKLQGKGIGKVLVEDAEQAAIEYGYKKIILHARTSARGFYEKLGYYAYGEVFAEVTIPHITMEKAIG